MARLISMPAPTSSSVVLDASVQRAHACAAVPTTKTVPLVDVSSSRQALAGGAMPERETPPMRRTCPQVGHWCLLPPNRRTSMTWSPRGPALTRPPTRVPLRHPKAHLRPRRPAVNLQLRLRPRRLRGHRKTPIPRRRRRQPLRPPRQLSPQLRHQSAQRRRRLHRSRRVPVRIPGGEGRCVWGPSCRV